MTSPFDFDLACSVFAKGFAFTRSFTHPFRVETLADGVCVLHDAPRKSGDYRTSEVVVSGAVRETVEDVVALAQKGTQGRFALCYLLPSGRSDTSSRAQFKKLGYRLMTTEDLMVRHLEDGSTPLQAPSSPCPIERVTTEEQAARLAKAARRRQILSEHLTADPAPMRQYMAVDTTVDGAPPIGWVGSVVVGDCTWCTSMYVAPPYRRQGIARAMLWRMLADDCAAGSRANVLLASHTGSKLYPTVGYETLGTLYMYMPPKKQ